MSSLFLRPSSRRYTFDKPLCAHLLVLTFGTIAGYYTHVSELSS